MSTSPPKTEDVARAAGVSRATVSYVLNDRRDARVSDATRERVLEAARNIGYVGSPAARALRNGRGEVVLFLVPEWEVEGQLELLLEEIGQRVAQQNLVCLRYEGSRWQGSLDSVLSRIPAACVITFDPLSAADAQTLKSAGVPEVTARLLDRPGKPHTTAISQDAIVAAQVDHLLDQGYRRLAYLAIEEPRGQDFTAARTAAFERICSDRSVTHTHSATVRRGGSAIAEAVAQWTSETNDPLGIVAWNDLTGLGIISAANDLNLPIPGRLGVIGGDESLIAALTRPTLSSVRFNLQSEAAGIAAQIAAALGNQLIDQEATSEAVSVIERESTDRLALL